MSEAGGHKLADKFQELQKLWRTDGAEAVFNNVEALDSDTLVGLVMVSVGASLQ